MKGELSHMDLLSDPIFKEFIEAFMQLSRASEQLSLPEVRARSTQFFLSRDPVYESVERTEDLQIIGNDGNFIPLRIFVPKAETPLPVLMFFHRGGWVFGSVEEADPVCRKLANHVGCVVISVDYRLAPENPFPKPLEDCYEATKWAAANCKSYGGDADKLIVCGESAGGNMASVVTMMARDMDGPAIAAQVLICPVISSTINDEVYKNSVDRYFITKGAMKFFWEVYLQSPTEGTNPYASPEKSPDLKGLPPALVVTAEYDPLAIEAERYGQALKQAGVPVIVRQFPEVIHSFIDLPIYPESEKKAWIEQIGQSLNELLPLHKR